MGSGEDCGQEHGSHLAHMNNWHGPVGGIFVCDSLCHRDATVELICSRIERWLTSGDSGRDELGARHSSTEAPDSGLWLQRSARLKS
jgi:hypothetical protein